MQFCDTHIHLLDPAAKGMENLRVVEAAAAGIDFLIQPGVRATDWDAMLALTEKHPRTYAAPGIHPMCVDQWDDEAALRLRELVRHPKVVAIGEIGLDAVVDPMLETQEQALRAQLQIGLDEGLPVLLHCRRKNGALLDILRELNVGQRIGGVWHGFSGSSAFARELVALGFYIGVGPILLRNNVRKLLETVEDLPLSALVLETDFPDMARAPAELVKVAKKIAEIKNLTLSCVAQMTTSNVHNLFGKIQNGNR